MVDPIRAVRPGRRPVIRRASIRGQFQLRVLRGEVPVEKGVPGVPEPAWVENVVHRPCGRSETGKRAVLAVQGIARASGNEIVLPDPALAAPFVGANEFWVVARSVTGFARTLAKLQRVNRNPKAVGAPFGIHAAGDSYTPEPGKAYCVLRPLACHLERRGDRPHQQSDDHEHNEKLDQGETRPCSLGHRPLK